MPNQGLSVFINISQVIIGILAIGFLLYIGRDIALPLLTALLLAILVNPIVYFFEHRVKLHRILAIAITVFLTFLFLAFVVYFIASQIANLTENLPQFSTRLNETVENCIRWFADTFNMRTKNIRNWVAEFKSERLGDGTAMLGKTIATIGGVLFYIFLLPVYMFFFLYYKPLLLEFIAELFPKAQHETVAGVLIQSKTVIQSYLVGLCLEFLIMAVLNTTALLIIGIDYAILIGILGALLNVIPYIGGLTSLALPVLMALVSDQPTDALWVFGAYMLIQFFDNNFLMVKIVASKVKVNALISIIVVLIGGALWGVMGMFLSLPITAILKVIFDRVEPLKPWGMLIGDTMPHIYGTIFNYIKKRTFKKVAKPTPS